MHWTYSEAAPSLCCMDRLHYGVEAFVRDLRSTAAAQDEASLVERVKPLLSRLASSRSWLRPELYECDPALDFGVTVLHEEADHRLWLVAVSWRPGRGAPPHNHGTWAVIAGVNGAEKNILWRARDGRLEPQSEEVIGPGQAIGFLPSAIHSVKNEGPSTTLSLHVYGRNLNFVERSQFDPETGAEKPFRLHVQ